MRGPICEVPQGQARLPRHPRAGSRPPLRPDRLAHHLHRRRDDLDLLGAAVAPVAGVERGFNVSGPYPADTVFVRARKGAFDAVLTMYHDQGQIAMKLIGFERGVTLLGGFPFPICTPAHGTAYDIAWKGIANPVSMKEALLAAFKIAPLYRPF